MAKSDKNIVRDILKAQGVYVHGDTPEPTVEAIKVLSDYGHAKWREGYNDSEQNDAGF